MFRSFYSKRMGSVKQGFLNAFIILYGQKFVYVKAPARDLYKAAPGAFCMVAILLYLPRSGGISAPAILCAAFPIALPRCTPQAAFPQRPKGWQTFLTIITPSPSGNPSRPETAFQMFRCRPAVLPAPSRQFAPPAYAAAYPKAARQPRPARHCPRRVLCR